jgi:calcium-dependent protein kinase
MQSSILAASIDWRHTRRWAKVSSAAIDFVKGLLVRNPEKRLDAQAALNHPWLASATATVNKPVLPAAALRSFGSYADAPSLRRAVLQLVAREFAPTDVADLRGAFLDIATDEEGTVSFSDLKAAIRGDEPQCQSDPKTPARKMRRAKTQELREMFHLMDVNGDDQVYYSDFLAAAMDQKMKEEHLWAAFRRLDADNSGAISVEDIQNVIGNTFEGVETREIGFDAFRRALDTRTI